MAQLGEAIAYFQHLEDTMSDCIASLAARDRKVGRIVSSELSFRAKILVFVALFLHRTGLAELPSKCQFPLLTLLDAPDFTRLATRNPKSGPALPPGSGGSRGDARRHPFPSP
jgi:hypothetical protein